jgi:hypothetical protein
MNSSVKSLAFAGIVALAWLAPAQAAGVCNCCSGQVEELCTSACQETNQANAVCRPAAWFGDADAVGGDKPLNGFSYKGLDLSDASRQELEVLRAWLERQRRATERRANRSLRNMKRGRASMDEFKASQAEREEAIVNYQHGIQAYLAAVRGL